ncbi:germinal-center associated nuclear protein [Gouania willdenowi]|uniref:Germinal-center associated nuclear protein n=1 Tax=Gouania willdenowi TaxID=441366 RepID=A0A8C5GYW1_GOUWI|nr:germinal-center associated nuclear protein [Gouania willdenowi]
MNPSNPFGSTSGGAFQAPNGTMKSGLFPTFRQQNNSQTHGVGFFQPSAMNQQPVQGNLMIGQVPAFGQTSLQPPAFGQTSSQPSTFGQTSSQPPAFGQTSSQPPAFGQTSSQPTTFGQTSSQPTTFGQTSSQPTTFGQTSSQPSTFGQTSSQPSTFGQTSSQPSTFGQTSLQPSTFGQTSSQPSTFGQTSSQPSIFGQTSSQPSTFGQTSSQPSTFGQTSSQPSTFGQTSSQPSTFGQTSSQPSTFGQTSSQPSAFGQTSSQPSAFGQTSAQPSTFGQISSQPPSFGQASAQPPTFGQTPSGTSSTAPAFGLASQSSVFGLASAFGQASGFGKQSSGFRTAQTTAGSTTALGQPAFGQPSSTSVATTVFSTVTPSKSIVSSGFGFKPSNEVLFKPIFSASPEPTNPQTTTLSTSPFSSSGPKTSFSTSSTTSTSGFSLSSGAKPVESFSFSHPAATFSSVSAQSTPSTSSDSSASANTIQFTFSQPAALSSSKTPTTEPTTPSSFSFTSKVLEPKPTPLFGDASFGQPLTFGDTKIKTDAGSDVNVSSHANLGATNVFARLSKYSKRKSDPAATITDSENPPPPSAEDNFSPETDTVRHAAKRPLMRSRGPPGGLFGRALSGLRKDNTMKRDATKEMGQQVPVWEEADQGQDKDQSETPSTIPPLMREMEKKAVESDAANVSGFQLETTPAKRHGTRSESSDSLSGLSPTDSTGIQCRNVPSKLNKREILKKHFSQFGKVLKVYCRPSKNVAYVHFDNHASAVKAKKKGKVLQCHELLLLWLKKKNHSGDKSSAEKETPEEKSQSTESNAASSLRKPTLRPAVLPNPEALSLSSPVKKASIVKNLQFDTEPQRDSNMESMEPFVPSSLLHLVGQVAETAEDKYRLLEQKDKVLRQDRPKRTDLDLSKVFVGTCPDMCPEKERYMRETRKQLSVFEVILNTDMVDHTAAVKEYSRSSADQEEPLPHELRPLPVLSMTMDYLVTQIMDQDRENYRDWYDFVWNRTRGIRKDITQQRLCCPLTVSLIEKCTRFHVHCAHHLCEEPMKTFDAKINNENMTKCLQSLKEMYEDLAMHQVFCPNEAEFRLYSVLLNLNEGDILREVQQFREEIRNSPEVKFAVNVFAAVNSNNFVRFFKLVKGAPYLASCLLHRYFNQVRAKALKTLNMAHTVGPRSTGFPIEDMVRMLMFKNVSEANHFVQLYGLNSNDSLVELSRVAYQEPELPPPQSKSEVILVKKMVLVGEVVNGGPLPIAPNHVPVCSFDSQNKYRGESSLAEPASAQFIAAAERVETKEATVMEQLSPVVPVKPLIASTVFPLPPAVPQEIREPSVPHQPPAPLADPQQLFQPIFPPEPAKAPSPPPQPQPLYSDEEITAELDSVIMEVVDATVRAVADAGVSYTEAALAESSAQVESIVGDVLERMLQEMSSTEIKLEQERQAEQKRKQEEARRKKEHEDFLREFSFSLTKQIVYEVVDESIQKTAAGEIQAALNEKAEHLAKCTEWVCSSLIEETLNADIAVLVEDILENELQLIQKYIKRWRDVVTVRRQLKRQMRGFPAAPCCVDPRFKLKALAPSAPAQPSLVDLTRGFVDLGHAGKLAVSSTRLLKMRQEVIHQMRVHYYYQQLLDDLVWAPLDLPAQVMENIPDHQDRIFWKAVLLLPSDHQSVTGPADRILSDWLEVKFGGDQGCEMREEQAYGTLQTLCVINTLQEHKQRTHKVHITIKASRGPLTQDCLSKMEEHGELQGSRALIMLLPALPAAEAGQEEQDIPLLSALLQLKQLQQVSSWYCPLPLVLFVPETHPGAADTRKYEEALMLNTLINEGVISEYTFYFIPESTNDLQGSKQLSHALCWLLSRAPSSFPLSCHTLDQLIEGALNQMFKPLVCSNSHERAEAFLPSQDPAPIIQLFNAVVAHIADKVTSEELCKLSWPPGEFCLPETRGIVPYLDWNSAEQLAWLKETILTLQLPQWSHCCITDSWSEICSGTFQYAAQIPASHLSQPLLMSRLQNLLERVRLKTLYTQRPVKSGQRDNSEGSAYQEMPWEEVVMLFIDHKLKDWRLPRAPVCEDALTEDGEILVYYMTDSLKGFTPPEEWIHTVNKTHREKKEEEASAAGFSTPATVSAPLRQRLFHTAVDPDHEAPVTQLDISYTPSPQERLVHRVLHSIEEEKAESKRSMEQLQRWLNGNPMDHLTLPLFLPSSTLLSMPTTPSPTPTAKSHQPRPKHGSEPEEMSEESSRLRRPSASPQFLVQQLQRQILASQEEERACRLELSSLLSIVDD